MKKIELLLLLPRWSNLRNNYWLHLKLTVKMKEMYLQHSKIRGIIIILIYNRNSSLELLDRLIEYFEN